MRRVCGFALVLAATTPFSTSDASAAARCEFDPATRTATVQMAAGGESSVFIDARGRLRVSDGRITTPPSSTGCNGATATSVDLLRVFGVLGSFERLRLPNPLGPGATPEPDGKSEITVRVSFEGDGQISDGSFFYYGDWVDLGDGFDYTGPLTFTVGRTALGEEAINVNDDDEADVFLSGVRQVNLWNTSPIGGRFSGAGDGYGLVEPSRIPSIFVQSEGGDDEIIGGLGADFLIGGPGDDRMDGRAGNDNVYGGDGDDVVLGGPGRDYLFDYPGRDVLRGGSGNDVLWALNDGDVDRLDGGPGVDEAQLQACFVDHVRHVELVTGPACG